MPKLRAPEAFDAAYRSPFGCLAIRMDGDAVVRLVANASPSAVRQRDKPAARRALQAVCTYIESGNSAGLPPVHLSGTDFQLRVWKLLLQIPRGRTRTYGDIARELASSARAVGGACRANPIVLLVPCHRIVAARGLGGFAGHATGSWPDLKRRLLATEGVSIA